MIDNKISLSNKINSDEPFEVLNMWSSFYGVSNFCKEDFRNY